MDLSKLSPENKKLALALLKAGRIDDARALIGAYGGPRVGRGELGERGEILARGKQIGLDREDLFVPEESAGSKFVADLGAGFVDQGLGLNQLVQHAIPGKDTADIDRRVQEAGERYRESGLADEVTGGRFASNVIPALGGGLLARGAIAARPWLSGAVMGGAEEAVQPIEEVDDYWSEKGKDIAVGTTIGLATEGATAIPIGSARAVVNAPGAAYRKLQEPSAKDTCSCGTSIRKARGLRPTGSPVRQVPG